MKRVLIACEYSGIVREAFKKRGFDAWSCDLLPTEIPGQHYQGDVLNIFDGLYLCKCGNLFEHSLGKYGCCGIGRLIEWDMMIAFPPCTHLALSGAKHFEKKRKDGRQQEGIDFFLEFTKTSIPKVCIENPIGIMSSVYRKPDQIINPFDFGDPYKKPTCIWLKNLPKLQATNLGNAPLFGEVLDIGEFHTTKSGKTLPKWYNMPPGPDRWKERSRTFQGIADAMAQQWGDVILNGYSTPKQMSLRL